MRRKKICIKQQVIFFMFASGFFEQTGGDETLPRGTPVPKAGCSISSCNKLSSQKNLKIEIDAPNLQKHFTAVDIISECNNKNTTIGSLTFQKENKNKMLDFKPGNSTMVNTIIVKNFSKDPTCKVFLHFHKAPRCWTLNEPTDIREAKDKAPIYLPTNGIESTSPTFGGVTQKSTTQQSPKQQGTAQQGPAQGGPTQDGSTQRGPRRRGPTQGGPATSATARDKVPTVPCRAAQNTLYMGLMAVCCVLAIIY